MPLRYHDTTATDVGSVRSVNEDSCIALPQAGLWVVADGMGGHEGGQHASSSIVAGAERAQLPDDLGEACAVVADTIHAVNLSLFNEGRERGVTMGSTLVALVVRGREFAVLWAGDSRAYVYRGRQLIALTRDHTQVQEMVDRGLLSPDQVESHPMKHVLSRAVGVQETLEIDGIRDEALPGDLFLLCSDGLHGVLSEPEIAGMLERLGQNSADALISACLERGAPDNVTVAIVSASEPTSLSFG